MSGLATFGLAAVEAADDGLPLSSGRPAPVILLGSFSGTDGQSIWRYDVVADLWTQVLIPSPAATITLLRRIPDGRIFSQDDTRRFYRSDDAGLTWVVGAASGLFPGPTGDSLRLPVGIDETGRISTMYPGYPSYLSVPFKLRYSDDLGATWYVGLDAGTDPADAQTTNGELRYIWAAHGHVYWNWIDTGGCALSIDPHYFIGLPGLFADVPVSATAYRLIPRGTYDDPVIWLWAHGDSPIWRYDGALHSIGLPSGEPVDAHTLTLTIIPVSASEAYLCYGDDRTNYGGRVYRTHDGGISWEKVLDESTTLFPNAGRAPGTEVLSVGISNRRELVAVGKGGFYHSLDNGINWDFIAGPTSDIQFANAVLLPADQTPGSARYPSAGAGETWGPELP